MPYPLREDIKAGTRLAAVPLSDLMNVVASVLNQIDGKAGAILITKTASGKGWTLAVVPDNSTLEVASGQLRVKSGGVGANQLAAGAVTSTKLAAGAVTTEAIAASAVTTGRIKNGAVTYQKTVGVNAAVALVNVSSITIQNGLITNIA